MSAVIALVVILAAALTAGASGKAHPGRSGAEGDTIRFVWATEPPSLDPALAIDTPSQTVLLNIMDPLVVLKGKNLTPTPSLASGWRISGGGKIVTIRLRPDGHWTNGRAVTAEDFEYSWKRVLDPALAAPRAYFMYAIKGARAYNTCRPEKEDCARLRNAVGVSALDTRTIRVTLAQPQPWFPQLLALNTFLAVPRETVERYGNKWAEPGHIVTNGPFELAVWKHDAELDLAKWTGWRNASSVSVERVNGRIITDGTTAELAFKAGEVDALAPHLLSPQEIPAWKGKPAYYESPALNDAFYGFNVKKIPDPNQRRAMAIAIDRRAIIDHLVHIAEPATGFTPPGIAGFATINPHSRWLPARGNLAAARQLMAKVAHPVRNVTLYSPSLAPPGVDVAVQGMWQQIGIKTTLKQQEWKQYLSFLGPPPNSDIDLFGLGWYYAYPDAMDGLETLTCGSGNNFTNWCDKDFDTLLAKARSTQNNARRYRLYAQLEKLLFGPTGAVPLIPWGWAHNATLVGPRIRSSFRIDPQNLIHFAEIKVKD